MSENGSKMGIISTEIFDVDELAERLAAAARDMQTALHCPDRERATLAVEECVLALEAVLDALR